jgi:TolB protein
MRIRRFRRRAIGGLVVLALSGAAVSVAGATAPGQNGKLAFRRYLDADHTWSALFTSNTNGSGVRQITHPKRRVLDIVPNWSPDGRQIVFQRISSDRCGPDCETDDVYRVKADGSGLTALTHDEPGKGCIRQDKPAGGTCRGVPTWSPNGKQIAFECATLSAPQTNPYLGRICVMGSDGSDAHQLPQSPATGVGDSAPSWSPDGKRIAFQRTILDAHGAVMRDAVFAMDADGSNVHRVTPWALRAGQPDWSPDGRRILFYSNWGGPPTISANLYTIGAGGSALRQVTHARGGKIQHLGATFSPDGKWIAFSRTPSDGGNADVFVMRADGTGLRNVTRSSTWDSGVDWGPRR